MSLYLSPTIQGPRGRGCKSLVHNLMGVPQVGTLIFSYIRRLGPFFLGQLSEFQYFLGFSEK